jgi:DNA-binding transcriptional MerR regulator
MSGNGSSEGTATKNLYRIGEVSRLTDTKPFVLRYWETEFPSLQPVKSASGHRLYRREDVDTVLHIKRLLYDEGFTIAGARRHLSESGGLPSEPEPGGPVASPVPAQISRKVLLDLRDALRSLLTVLESE